MPRAAAPAVVATTLVASLALACDAAPESAQRQRDGAAGPTVKPGVEQPVIELVDAAGRTHRLDGPARRIVSLVPSATATLVAIGARDRLVGVSDYDVLDSLPSVGGGLEPNLEALVALEPDAVLRFAGEQDPRTPARLDALGIRHVAVRPVDLDDLYETNRILGRLTGREPAADSLSAAIRLGLERLSRSVEGLPRKRVVYMLGGSPPWVAGPGTYITEMLELVGADNVFDDLDAPYSAVSPEELRSRDVDVVLVPRAGAHDEALTPGARVEVVGDALEVPGPDVVRVVREMAEAVHGRSLR